MSTPRSHLCLSQAGVYPVGRVASLRWPSVERALTIASASADVLDAHAKGGASALGPLHVTMGTAIGL
jgi:hypothetical protein